MAGNSFATLQEVVTALRKALDRRLIGVVLFGSRARGDANEASDWDLLVIARDLPERPFARHLLLKSALPTTWRARVAILAKTPIEFEAALGAVYLDIALDGVVLYDPEAYVAARLARLRQLIEARGLRREMDQRDLTWHWQRFPCFDWSLEWEAA